MKACTTVGGGVICVPGFEMQEGREGDGEQSANIIRTIYDSYT